MILVTGGTGLVGSHLLYRLVNSGRKVRALVHSKNSLKNVRRVFEYYRLGGSSLIDQIEWIEGDILDYCLVHEATRDIEQIYHAAALVSFNPFEKSKILKTNVYGTVNMVNAALLQPGVKFCHVSSVAAFGTPENDEAANEKTSRSPDRKYSAYSISKFDAEMEVWRGIHEGLNAVIVNPSVIHGYHHWKNGSSQIFPAITRGLRFIPAGSTGFVDVKDVVELMIRLTDSNISGERFCISSENLSYWQVFQMAATALGKKSHGIIIPESILTGLGAVNTLFSALTGISPLITVDSARSASKNSSYSNEKIRKLFDYEFIPIENCINSLAGEFRKEG